MVPGDPELSSRRMIAVNTSRNAEGVSRQALQFFGLAILAIGFACLLTYGLCRLAGKSGNSQPVLFPPAFGVSTLILLMGSYSLHRAVKFVRLERQGMFRTWLLNSLLLGTLFMGVQSYALWSMFPAERAHETASLGVAAFVLCLATLHGLHFVVALLFVVLVISRTWADRYDHEYYWGVRACAWFWHFLGLVWCAILAVIAIAL